MGFFFIVSDWRKNMVQRISSVVDVEEIQIMVEKQYCWSSGSGKWMVVLKKESRMGNSLKKCYKAHERVMGERKRGVWYSLNRDYKCWIHEKGQTWSKNASVSILHSEVQRWWASKVMGRWVKGIGMKKLGTCSWEAILSLHGRVWITMATVVIHQQEYKWRCGEQGDHNGKGDGTENTIQGHGFCHKSCEEFAGFVGQWVA